MPVREHRLATDRANMARAISAAATRPVEDDLLVRFSSSLRPRLALVLALLLCFGVGGFFAITAIDEGTKRELACTAMGCSSGISVKVAGLRRALPQAARVQLCAGAGCASWKPGRWGVPWVESEWRGTPKNPHATYTADVEVLDRRGRVLLHLRQAVRLQRFEPNGHACGPTCWFAGLRLDAAHRRLVAVQS